MPNDAVILVHLAFVLFVAFGGVLVLNGLLQGLLLLQRARNPLHSRH